LIVTIRVLYISYDGLLSPLGQSQVLAYQEKLADEADLHILSFEKKEDIADAGLLETVEARVRKAGITWHRYRYHKSPTALATGFDIIAGTVAAIWHVLRYRISIVHTRSYVPAVMGLATKKVTGAKFVFDMRGFWADERVEGALWPADGRLYKLAKWFEKRFLINADAVISLTKAALVEIEQLDYLRGRLPPVTIIPTCVNLGKFRPMCGRDNGDFILGYVGSVGTWYRFDAVISTFLLLLEERPDSRLLIVNRGEHDYIRERLGSARVPEASVELRSANHDDVPFLMNQMDAGVFFIQPVFSKKASAPTKLGEFLGCGIPCLANTKVGDMSAILEGEKVGVAVSSFEESSLREGISRLLELAESDDISDRCVAASHKHFSLEEGVQRYSQIYKQLVQLS